MVKNLNKAALSKECLQSNRGCTSNIVEEMNNFSTKNYSNISTGKRKTREDFEADQVLSGASCVGNLLGDKKGMDELNSMVASTGVGLLAGGAGGVFRLGQMATRVFETGSRMKAVGSASLLAGEVASSATAFSSVASECKEAINHLEKESANVGPTCSKENTLSFKLTSLNSCVINMSLTALPFLASLRPIKAATIAKEEKEAALLLKKEKEGLVDKITNPLISEKDKKDLAESMANLHLTRDETEEMVKKLNKIITSEKDKNRLKNYVNFVLHLKPDEQKLALEKLNDVVLVSSEFNPGGYVQKFYQKENRFYLYENYKRNSIKKDLMSQGRTEAEAAKEAEALARESRAALQKRYYACQSKTVTPEIKSAAAKYTAFSMALGVGGTASGYYVNNKEKLDSHPEEFYGKLGYDIAMTYFLTKISSQIIKSPDGNLKQRYVQASVGSAQLGVIDAVVYSKLYGGTEEDARKKVEGILHSKDAQKELLVLDQYINREGLIEKFKDNIVETYKKVLASNNSETILGKVPYKISDEKFSTLTEADLKKTEVKERLVKAVLTQMNTGDMSAFMSTGDKGVDRWVNDRAWNAAIGIPKGIIVGMGIFQVLCLGADNPVASLGIATGIQFAHQFLSGDMYYKFRKETIGQ